LLVAVSACGVAVQQAVSPWQHEDCSADDATGLSRAVLNDGTWRWDEVGGGEIRIQSPVKSRACINAKLWSQLQSQVKNAFTFANGKGENCLTLSRCHFTDRASEQLRNARRNRMPQLLPGLQ
jgi:hypothetical protein